MKNEEEISGKKFREDSREERVVSLSKTVNAIDQQGKAMGSDGCA